MLIWTKLCNLVGTPNTRSCRGIHIYFNNFLYFLSRLNWLISMRTCWLNLSGKWWWESTMFSGKNTHVKIFEIRKKTVFSKITGSKMTWKSTGSSLDWCYSRNCPNFEVFYVLRFVIIFMKLTAIFTVYWIKMYYKFERTYFTVWFYLSFLWNWPNFEVCC